MTHIPIVYLTSYALSLLGNSIMGIAFPLIVLQITGSALGAGAVAAATAVPAVLAGVLAGVVIDRINRRTASVVADLISAATVAALPLIDMFSGLNLGWFILCGVLGSLGDIPGMTARETLLPAIVRQSGIPAERLVGIREAIGSLVLLIGPAAAGTLMVLFSGSTVLWITAATSAAAALSTLLLPRSVGAVPTGETPPLTPGVTTERAPTTWSELRAGWRMLFSNRFLLTSTALSVISVMVLAPLQGLVLPVHFTAIEEPGMLGFVISALAAGMLLGSVLYAAAGTRGRRRVWFVTGLLGTGVGFGVIGALGPVWTILAGAGIVGLASGLFGGLIGVLMIERIPEDMRGRVMGTQNSLMMLATPAGLVVVALLTEYGSARFAALALACLWLGTIAIGLFAKSLRTLEAPVGTDTNSEDGYAQR